VTQDLDGTAHYNVGLAIADFDSDGRDDLAIGAPNQAVPGAPCAIRRGKPQCQGTVMIVPGAVDGLALGSSVVLAQGIDGLVGSSEPNDQFGEFLAAGDLNGDGWMDLAIGAPGETIDMLCVEVSCGHGAVTVVYGSVDGLVPSSSSAWTLETPGVPGQLYDYVEFGRPLTIGSFGRGRAADLAIGVPVAEQARGYVAVLYGTRAGLSAPSDDPGYRRAPHARAAEVRRPAAQLWSPSTDGVAGTSAVSDYFGWALSE
jgi:hypothetical protein